MLRTFLLPVSALLLFAACSKSANDSTTISVNGDSVVMAVDTASALPDSVPSVKKVDEGPRLDSLASAETTLEFMKNSGHWDAYQAGIIPSIMQQNLDYARRLLRNRHKYFIIVDKGSMNVILYDKYGREEKCYRMACSRYYGTKHKRRDNRTPEGFFSAEGIYNSTDWLYTNDDGYTSPAKGQFGPRFIRLKTPVTSQVGIHGTSSPNSPGHRVSHGCIRLRNENILDLVKYATTGMPIIVNPSERDQKVNRDEGYEIVKLDIGKAPYGPAEAKKDKEADRAKAKEQSAKADSTKTEKAPADSADKPAKEVKPEKTEEKPAPAEPSAPAQEPKAE